MTLVYLEVGIHCDGNAGRCREWVYGYDPEEVRTKVDEQNWVSTPAGTHYCPEHQ
jgi:hypothetical protein